MMRLNKFLALSGIASRRKADQLIQQGEVVVNGQVVNTLGVQIDPQKDWVKVSGKHIEPPKATVYLIFNKPKNIMVTKSDPENRPTVYEYLKKVPKNVFSVGRLDFDTEGLLLFTNDGDLAYQLTHPKFSIPRTYHAKVKGVPDEKALTKLRRGMYVNGVRLRPSQITLKKIADANAWLEITVTEGKNRQVRDMCAFAGFPVSKLIRVSYGNLKLGSLPQGKLRPLTEIELTHLKKLVSSHAERPPKSSRPPRSKAKWPKT